MAKFDPVTVLPEAEKLKFIALRDEAADRNAIARQAAQALEDARADLNRASINLVLYERQPVARTVEELDRFKANVAAAEAEMRRLSDNAASRTARSQAIGHLARRLEDYIGGLSVTTKLSLYANGAKRSKEPPAETVSKARDQIAALRQQLLDIETAPYPREEILAAMEVQIRAFAAAGAPDLDMLIAAGGNIGWPEQQHLVGAAGSVFIVNVPALVAWLSPEALIKKLSKEIEDAADDDGEAVPRAERPKRIRAIRDELLTVERIEETGIEDAAKGGAEIERRSDADPRAVLGLASSLPAPRDY